MTKRKCGIYGIHNLITGKWYVGKSVDISRRKFTHFLDLHHRRHSNKLLQDDYDQHGKKSFEFMVLENTSIDVVELAAKETFWISAKGAMQPGGYNLFPGCMPSPSALEELGLDFISVPA